MNTADRYRRWFAYERSSHRAVLEYLGRCSDQVRYHPGFQKAVDLMAHIVAARRLWLSRMGVSKEKLELSDLEPQKVAFSALPDVVNQTERMWADYMIRLDEAELRRTFEYKSFDAGKFRNVVEDILMQLHGHSLYHRGQIALLVRQAGGVPTSTDFLFW